MLRFLSIKNIILIDSLNIDFSNGLCVLTGETGAGKSIILDSLGLVIGYRADYSIRPKNEKITEITATFSDIFKSETNEILKNLGIENSDEIILKRQLSNDNKSKSFINDHLVSLNTLKALGSHLIEIQSQFSEQGLLDSSTHINVLDEYGELFDQKNKVRDNWLKMEKVGQELKNLHELILNIKENKENIEYDLKELNNFQPKSEEYETLINKKKNYVNATKIEENLNLVINNFSSDQKKGIEDLISENIKSLINIDEYLDKDTKAIVTSLDSMLIEIQEYKNKLESFKTQNFLGDSNLDELEDRIYQYRKLSKKHDCNVNDLIEIQNSLNKKNESLDIKEIEIEKKENYFNELKEQYNFESKKLSEQRKRIANIVDEQVNLELPSLKLENAEFKTIITDNNSGINGRDKVVFKIKTNKNQELDELKKITSGGELCRFALAIKVVTSKRNTVSIVFDEVDSGIGGAVASAVGERLRKLGSNRQVLVVTHSPQVASLGNEHFKVKKINKLEETLTMITKLERSDRIKEIARMLSGKEITREAEAAAIKLLED